MTLLCFRTNGLKLLILHSPADWKSSDVTVFKAVTSEVYSILTPVHVKGLFKGCRAYNKSVNRRTSVPAWSGFTVVWVTGHPSCIRSLAPGSKMEGRGGGVGCVSWSRHNRTEGRGTWRETRRQGLRCPPQGSISEQSLLCRRLEVKAAILDRLKQVVSITWNIHARLYTLNSGTVLNGTQDLYQYRHWWTRRPRQWSDPTRNAGNTDSVKTCRWR